MKPFHVAFGIGGATILIVGIASLKSKLDHDRNGREITRLIAEYKAIGVPTNGDELVKTIPDSENAWVEIGPILLSKQGTGTGNLFKSAVALELMMTCNKNDLPLMRKYLTENQPKRERIEAALTAKPKMQVPHDYDEGYMMLLPEYSAIRALTREYSLAAYVAGLEGNLPEAIRNLDLANRFATNCIESPIYVGTSIGASIRKNIIQASLRIIEANPALANELETYVTGPTMSTVADPKRVILSEFVAQISIARFFDVPEMDRPAVPSFLKSIVQTRTEGDIEKLGRVRHGDTIPDSSTMRKFLRNRLEKWQPILNDLSKSGSISSESFAKINDLTSVLPSKLSFLAPDQPYFDRDQLYRGIGLAHAYHELSKALFKAIAIKRKTGKYPNSFQEIGSPIRLLVPTDIVVYNIISDTVSFRLDGRSRSVMTNDQGLSFPASNSTIWPTYASDIQKVRKYRNGEILFDGTTTAGVAKPGSPTPIPPRAPKPAPTHAP
ncbi:MAG: hypothetical protein WCI55_11585 [Armatimonadota bacterium]